MRSLGRRSLCGPWGNGVAQGACRASGLRACLRCVCAHRRSPMNLRAQAAVRVDIVYVEPPLPDALLLVSKARVLLGTQRAAEAITCLHFVVGRAASLDQAQARLDAWLLLGEAHEAQGEGQQAMLAFGEALRSAPHGDAKGHLCAHRLLARGIFAPALG